MRPRLEVCVPDRGLCRLARALLPFADVVEKSVVDAAHPVVITTGNSFGQVSAGAEARLSVYLDAFRCRGGGGEEQGVGERVRQELALWYAGELPVGDAIVVPTAHPRLTRVIYAPCIHVAEDVSCTLNAYLAFKAALLLMQHNGVEAASTHLLGTSYGMDAARACRQMAAAYDVVVGGRLARAGRDAAACQLHRLGLERA